MVATAARTKVGEGRTRYQALTNISVPQRLDGVLTGQNDLVPAGEFVELTEREAAQLMRSGGTSGRQHAAIRPASESEEPLPRLHPRLLSGAIRQPVMPAPGAEGPRPDPPGASRIIETGPPEANEPQPGDERVVPADAIDIVPGTARTG
ncbi:MAG TPA: hypothetical protein VEV45_21005 [Streptosporangiaceae bacterium]|nr:hypothetical protein [Streptosporangiaceae bacterium]